MIKIIKSKLIESFKSRRINVFLLFFISAFVILVFNKLSKQYTNTLEVDINKVNVPEEYIILNDSSSNLSLTLKTHGFRWFNYYLKKPIINIDFEKDVFSRDSVFVWTQNKAYLNNTQFDDQVELLNMSPDTLKFKYSVNMVKKVPVILDSKIEFSQGYDLLGKYTVEPDSIQIIGPGVMVSKINELKTEHVELVNVKANISKNLNLNLANKHGNIKYSHKKVNLTATVEKFTEGILKVPVTLENVPAGVKINYFPKYVSVSYYVNLSNYHAITKNDFKVVCDYSEVGDNQSFMSPKLIDSPKSVKQSRIHQNRVEFIIIE